jgi:hypothetical protein
MTDRIRLPNRRACEHFSFQRSGLIAQQAAPPDVIRHRLAARLAWRCQFTTWRDARPRGGGPVMIRSIKLRRFEKNTLKGFVDLELTHVGLVLRNCTWHQHADRKEWVGFPARSYQDQNGETKWQPLVAGPPNPFSNPPNRSRHRRKQKELTSPNSDQRPPYLPLAVAIAPSGSRP